MLMEQKLFTPHTTNANIRFVANMLYFPVEYSTRSDIERTISLAHKTHSQSLTDCITGKEFLNLE